MAIEGVAEEIATNLEEVAEVTRRVDTRAVGFLFGGILIGASVGFYFGHRWNREKIKAEAFKESQEEVEKIREMYRQKSTLTGVVSALKPPVEQIIEERGYSTKEPETRPLKAPVPMHLEAVPPPVQEPLEEAPPEWNYGWELANRKKDEPYVIHKDEWDGSEGFTQTSYTYYEVDDVLTDTDDRPLPHADLVVGQTNLKFGHGSGDPNQVYVRNEKLEMEMEIIRVPRSYEEEVLGNTRDEEN